MSNEKSVVILNTMSEPALERAREIFAAGGCEVVVGPSFRTAADQIPYPLDELKELVQAADVVFASGSATKINGEVLTPTPSRLRGIVTSSLGYNAFDVKTCSELGVLVANSPVETNIAGVFQHTLMLILMLRRRLRFFDQWARDANHWSPMGIPEIPGLIDETTTVGVVGLGRIGYRVARFCRDAFGARVLAYDPYVPDERGNEIGIELVEDLHDLLHAADVVTVHTFLSDETRHLIGEAEFRAMKPTASIVNTSRGPVIDEAALLLALEEGVIASAALDVAETEPMSPDSPLLAMDNVLITPHVAGGSARHNISGTEFAATNVLRLMDNKVPKSLVNPEALDKWAQRFGVKEARYGGAIYYRTGS
jgi:D-3-phosphoglycerate dehydrogenase